MSISLVVFFAVVLRTVPIQFIVQPLDADLRVAVWPHVEWTGSCLLPDAAGASIDRVPGLTFQCLEERSSDLLQAENAEASGIC